MDDPALVARVAAGDEEALRELTCRYRAPLRRYRKARKAAAP